MDSESHTNRLSAEFSSLLLRFSSFFTSHFRLSVLRDYAIGIPTGIKLCLPHLFLCYVLIPLGIAVCLALLYGINACILRIGFTFPASVLAMMILFLLLTVSSRFCNRKRVSRAVSVIDVPLGFALRWINVVFTPAFITLALADPVTVREGGAIAGLFIAGYLVTMAACAYLVVAVQRVFRVRKLREGEEEEEVVVVEEIELEPVEGRGGADGGVDSVSGENGGGVGSDSSEFVARMSADSADLTDFTEFAEWTETEAETGAETGAEAEAGEADKSGISFNSVATITSSDSTTNTSDSTTNTLSPNSAISATFIATHIDTIIYFSLFIAGCATFFTTGCATIADISLVVLLFRAACRLPPQITRFAHPILVSSALSVFVMFLLSEAHKTTLTEHLKAFKTGRTYLKITNTNLGFPGAGDLLGSLLDVSIVALSVPMYTHRQELQRHWIALVVPTAVIGSACFWLYPLIAWQFGISGPRSVAFVSRNVTLALGVPLVELLDGSVSLAAVTGILTGILGVLFGGFLLGPRVLRIKSDDFVTRGVTLGLNSSAVATAHLLSVDPRAAALSSLSFVLYGTYLLVLAAIPPVAEALRRIVGM